MLQADWPFDPSTGHAAAPDSRPCARCRPELRATHRRLSCASIPPCFMVVCVGHAGPWTGRVGGQVAADPPLPSPLLRSQHAASPWREPGRRRRSGCWPRPCCAPSWRRRRAPPAPTLTAQTAHMIQTRAWPAAAARWCPSAHAVSHAARAGRGRARDPAAAAHVRARRTASCAWVCKRLCRPHANSQPPPLRHAIGYSRTPANLHPSRRVPGWQLQQLWRLQRVHIKLLLNLRGRDRQRLHCLLFSRGLSGGSPHCRRRGRRRVRYRCGKRRFLSCRAPGRRTRAVKA